jgi:hypothetical protein
MKRPLPFLLATLGILFGPAKPARADVVVTIGNATIAQGGTGSVDVMIRSTNPAGDPLSSFGFEFQLTPTGPRHLDFRNPQRDAQLTLPGYVFAGNSGDLVDGSAVGAVHSIGSGTNNQFVGGDETDSGDDVTVKGDVLLARLDLTAATSSPPQAGDTFSLSLLSGPFTGFRDSNNSPVAFSSTTGTITMAAAAVPEPSPVLLFLAGALLTGAVAVQSRLRRFAGDRETPCCLSSHRHDPPSL